MIFSQADFDLLRLLRWNRHLLPETIDGLFTERDIQNLIALGLIKIHQRSGSFVLTSKGNQLLNDTLSIAAPDLPACRNAAAAPPVHAGGDSIPRAYPHLYHRTGGIILQSFSFSYGSLPRPGA